VAIPRVSDPPHDLVAATAAALADALVARGWRAGLELPYLGDGVELLYGDQWLIDVIQPDPIDPHTSSG
jgi:hypothetical protein